MDRDKLLQWLKKGKKPGVYHNGGFGFPSLQVSVEKTAFGYTLWVFHNGKSESFCFTNNEIHAED